MSPEEQVRRGQRAALILNDDTFKAGIQALRDRAMEAFKNANPSDAHALQVARMEYDVTERLINEFAMFISDGRLSTIRIEAREQEQRKPRQSSPAA